MATLSPDKCGTCIYWREVFEKVLVNSPKMGDCFRHPPSMTPVPNSDGRIGLMALYPRVAAQMPSCGDYSSTSETY